MIVSSFKTLGDAMSVPPEIWPKRWTLEAYQRLFGPRDFFLYMKNSIKVALVSVVLGVFFGAWTGYGLSRFSFKLKAQTNVFILICQSFPSSLLIIPYFETMLRLRLYDTRWGLVLAYLSFTMPFCTWMSKAYFDSVPRELDDAALVDGCSPYMVFWRIVLPVAKPGLVATGIFAFLNAWNDYLFALILTSSDRTRTVPVALTYLVGEFMTDWSAIMAGAVVASTPVVIMAFVMQKQLIAGLTGGAVKG